MNEEKKLIKLPPKQPKQTEQNKMSTDNPSKIKLPILIHFERNDLNSISPDHLATIQFPVNETKYASFYTEFEVPITLVLAQDLSADSLRKYIDPRSGVLVDLIIIAGEAKMIVFCSQIGVLFIENPAKSGILQEFLKANQFYSKGQQPIQCIRKLFKCTNVINIDQHFLEQKHISTDMKELQNLFLPETEFHPSSFNSGITDSALNIYTTAFNISTLFMLLPIIQKAPMQLLSLTQLPKKLQACTQMKINFRKNILVSYIPNSDNSRDLLYQEIENIYDGKIYLCCSYEQYFGYGTKNGIVVTDSEISPFWHGTLPIKLQVDERINLLIRATKWKDNTQMSFIVLVANIYLNIKTTVREDDIEQNLDLPLQAPTFLKPATFSYPSGVPHPTIESQFTIIALPINPHLYIHFSYPVICLILKLQKLGFTIPQAADYDIQDLCLNCSNKEYQATIRTLINSLSKISNTTIQSLLKNIKPLSDEESTVARILNIDDLAQIKKKDVARLLKIFDRVFKRHNQLIKQLSSTSYSITSEINETMLNLLFSIKPSTELIQTVTSLSANPAVYSKKFEKLSQISNFLKTIPAKNQNTLLNKIQLFLPLFQAYISRNPPNMPINLIFTAINNLKQFNKNKSMDQRNLFVSDAIDMIQAAHTYINFCNEIQDNREYPNWAAIKKIEDLLFQLVFIPSEDNSSSTRVYSVYQMHDTFLFGKHSFINFKSSTGSGKTRCSPFFFAIKALMDKMERPFFIMTQPGSSIIDDKMEDFQNTMEDTVILVRKVDDLLKLYNTKPIKPVISLLSPQNALNLLVQAEKLNIDIISKTRFCLDEIHERSVFTDVLIAKLCDTINTKRVFFPLQVLMMSATPDERILHCFNTVKMCELPDSQLFPVKPLRCVTEKVRDISSEVVKQSIQILTNMAYNKKDRGHILIFTSGNSRIKEIIGSIKEEVKRHREENIRNHRRDNIRLIDNISFASNKEFYSEIDAQVQKDTTNLYLVLIPFAGYVSAAQKEIAKRVIKSHKNVIKIIVATNAIESSITIDKLAAVIDTGRYNKPLFDIQRGITLLSEEPISKQSRIQRKGRVGRVMPGTAVQIFVQGEETIDHLPPEIQTIDISSSILTLRKMGIKLESIRNLPDPVGEKKLKETLVDLYKIGALSPTDSNITETGTRITLFESLSPFLAAAIIRTCIKVEKNKLWYILGSLIVLIFNSSELVTDVFAEPLQKNFDENSDIITLLKTFLELVNKEKSIKLRAQSYGLNYKTVSTIKSTTETIAANFKVRTEEKSVFVQLQDFLPIVKIMNFIDIILNNIERYKKDWIKCRRCVYKTISYAASNPRLIYVGDSSLGFEEGDVQSEISISMRPGGKGLIAPGEAFVFNIAHNTSMKINFGSCIHRNHKPSTTNVIEPKACEAQRFLIDQEEFSRCLINSYLKGKESLFLPINTRSHTGKTGSTVFFYQSLYQNKTIITFVPNAQNAEEEFRKAVSSVAQLMPYTPSMILLRNSFVNCAVGINFINFNIPESHVYFFDDENYRPYPINAYTLEYCFPELTKPNSQTFIAITGEMLSIPMDEDCSIERDELCKPTVNDNCGCVFSEDPYYYNHLVILTNKKIPKQEPIPWIKEKITARDTETDYLIKLANGIFPGLFYVKHTKTRLFFRKKNTAVAVQGTLPHLQDERQLRMETHGRRVEAMFDRFAMTCIKNDRLCKNVDLKSFSVNGPTMPTPIVVNYFKKYLFNSLITPEVFGIENMQSTLDQAHNRIRQIKERKAQLSEMWNRGFPKRPIMNEQASLKTEKNALHARINELKFQISEICDQKSSNIVRQFKTYENYQKAYQLNQTELFISRINENEEVALDVAVDEVNQDQQIEQFYKIALPTYVRSSYIKEAVPIYNIHVNHVADSWLSENQFIEKIEKVCSRFGAIISQIFKYCQVTTKNSSIQGYVTIQMYSQDFVIPLITLLADEICGRERVILKLPRFLQFDPYTIATNQTASTIMKNWIKNNDLHIDKVGNRWIGNTQTDIDRAIELFESDPPEFPIKIIPIPGGINMLRLNNTLRSKYKTWQLNRLRRIIIVPSQTMDAEIENLFQSCNAVPDQNDDEEEDNDGEFTYMGDILYCQDNAQLSKRRVNIYNINPEADVTIKNFCVSCIKSSLVNSLGRMFDEESNSPDLVSVFKNTDCIPEISLLENPNPGQFIPIGQLFFSFVSESQIAELARTYITANAYQSLKQSPLLTFCPNHPGILLKKPPKKTKLECHYPGCGYALCPDCDKWHDNKSCPVKIPIPKGYRICPNCNRVIVKTCQCNRIRCQCGKHFCYSCNAGPFNTSAECYEHLKTKHNGYFNDPPDYLKFVKNDSSVTNEMLNDFYKKYPNIQKLYF